MENNKEEYIITDVYGGYNDNRKFPTEDKAEKYIEEVLIPEYGYSGFYPVRIK